MGLREKLATMPANRRREYLQKKLDRMADMEENIEQRKQLIIDYKAEVQTERDKN